MSLRALAQKIVSSGLILLIPPICWGANLTVGRAVAGELPPLALNWWRWAVAALILTLLVGRQVWADRAIILKHWKLLLMLSATGITGFHSAVYIGLNHTSAVNGALMVALGPVFILPLAVITGRERFVLRHLLGLGISFLGAAAVILRGNLGSLASLDFNRGDLWLLFASFLWGLYSVLLAFRPKELKPYPLLLASMIGGTLLTSPLYLWEMSQGHFLPFNQTAVLTIGFIAVFAAVIAYLAWNAGVKAVGPVRAGLYIYFIPFFAMVFAVIFLGEQLEWQHLVGFPLIIVGVWLTAPAKAKDKS